MKNLALTLALFVAAAMTMTVSAQEISIDKEVHDYGTVTKGADGSCYFTITNSGTEPLIVTRAKGSCGCTVPDWPREAIAPGASAKMKVTYDTKRPGPINKSVTITSNSKSNPKKVVRIKGTVKVPAPAVTPAN
ncbi:MAG: DUF1573 domain-containing protein [Flavobacteriales bacterium]